MEGSLDYLLGLDLAGFVAMFWYLIFLEGPRYILSAHLVALSRVSAPRIEGTGFRSGQHRISVLLACHNNADKLPFAARSIAEQTIGKVQVVVVNDGSTDETDAVVKSLLRLGLVDVYQKTDVRCGKAAALNLGFRYCTGDFVVTADADTSYDRDAFEKLMVAFDDPKVGAVAGNIAVRNWQQNLLTRMQAIQYLISISVGRQVNAMFDILFIVSGAFGAFRREAITAVGGWDVGPGDDSNLTIKVRRAGWRIEFAPDAWSMTDVPANMTAFTNQRLRWNRSLIRNRFRKFRSALNPGTAQFSLTDALGIIDVLFFQAALAFAWFFYLGWLFYNYGSFGWTVLGAVTVVQIIVTVMTFLAAGAAARRHARLSLLPFSILYSLFVSYLLRAIRVVAYLDELIFRHSYSDSFVPRHVRNRLERF
ncbi:MAG: glycosyltransferase [Alphaproteobacteria bacterium]|nr:glycosyltransferase [Alphaproteobacteria bacterium]